MIIAMARDKMNKYFFTPIISLFTSMVILGSCASIGSMAEGLWPLSNRLLSTNETIKKSAVQEFAALDNDGKKKTMLEIVSMFSSEPDPTKRQAMFKALTDLKAGSYIIVPLILAVRDNTNMKNYDEVINFIKGFQPATNEDLPDLTALLKSDRWGVRIMAVYSLARMSKNAETAMPEIIKTMHDFGSDPEKYEQVFDALTMINSDIAMTSVILDIKNKNTDIRKNAISKLFDLQAYLSDKLLAKKEIVPALIRALFDEDKSVSDIAKEKLSGIDDKEGKAALESYLSVGKAVMSILATFMGATMSQLFSSQEERMKNKMNDFYNSIGKSADF